MPSMALFFLRFGYGSPSWCLPIFPMSPFLSPVLPEFRQGFSSGCCIDSSLHVGGHSSCSSFSGCLLPVLALVAVSSCPPLSPSVVHFRFAFLVRLPPFLGFSALVFGRSLGSSVFVSCFVFLSLSFGIVVYASPFFPFGLWVLFCLGRISGPSATGSALWAASVTFQVFCAPSRPFPAHAFCRLGIGRLLLLSFS